MFVNVVFLCIFVYTCIFVVSVSVVLLIYDVPMSFYRIPRLPHKGSSIDALIDSPCLPRSPAVHFHTMS